MKQKDFYFSEFLADNSEEKHNFFTP